MGDSHKVGWHLGNARPMQSGDWDVLAAVPPASVTFISGEAIGSDQVARILQISPHCHFFLRPYYRPSDSEEAFRGYLEGTKAMITPGNWEVIPEGQRHLQIFNEVNMPHTAPIGHPTDQWEGFGPSEGAMERFNRWLCTAYDELKAVNPTWRIGFPPLTPGNRDCYFLTDVENVAYYMHGSEVSFGDPCDDSSKWDEETIQAAIQSGPCYEALERADEYLAHIYVLNDAEHQMHELWAGLRFAQYAKFFPKPMDIWITELGIGGDESNWVRWYELLEDYPEVKGTCIWRLGYEIRSAGDDAVKALKEYTGSAVPGPIELTPIGEPEPGPEPEPGWPEPDPGRCLVGLCGRNEPEFQPADYALVAAARIETLKMMSFAPPSVFQTLRMANPSLVFVVRLYDDRMDKEHHPTPDEFAAKMNPIVKVLQPYVNKFEVHNEPNHLTGIEGWGQDDEHALDFNGWFVETYKLLKAANPWARFGFPGLAVPHRDIAWLAICREAIELADWLGCHCYWQNPREADRNHLAESWGLRFKVYHDHYPDKDIHITEFGNSNSQSGYKVNYALIAEEYVEYYRELFKYPYVKSASAFLMSAPQADWWPFCWREESGAFRPVVRAVATMERTASGELPAPPPSPAVDVEGAIRNEAWNEAGVPYNREAAFYKMAVKLGMGRPVTRELDIEVGGVTYRWQGYDKAILACVKGDWGNVEEIGWLG